MKKKNNYDYKYEIGKIITIIDMLKNKYSIDGKPVFDYCVYTQRELDIVKEEMFELRKRHNFFLPITNKEDLLSWWYQTRGHAVFPKQLANKLYFLNMFYHDGNLKRFDEEHSRELCLWRRGIEDRLQERKYDSHKLFFEKEDKYNVRVKTIYGDDFLAVEIYRDLSDEIYDKRVFEWIRGFTYIDVFLDTAVEYIEEKFNEINGIVKDDSSRDEEFKKFQESKLPGEFDVLMIYGDTLGIRSYNGIKKSSFLMLFGIDSCGKQNLIKIEKCGKNSDEINWLEILNNLKSRGLNKITVISCYPWENLKEAAREIYPEALFDAGMDVFVEYFLGYIDSPVEIRKYKNAFMKLYDIADEKEAVNEFDRLVEERNYNYPIFKNILEYDREDVITVFKFDVAFRKNLKILETQKSIKQICGDFYDGMKIFKDDDDLIESLYYAVNAK